MLLKLFLSPTEYTCVTDQSYQHNSRSIFVVDLGHRPEALLACSVPYLHLEDPAVKLQRLILEIYADRGHVAGLVVVLGKAKQDVSLANSRIAQHHNLRNVVVGWFFAGLCHRGRN